VTSAVSIDAAGPATTPSATARWGTGASSIAIRAPARSISGTFEPGATPAPSSAVRWGAYRAGAGATGGGGSSTISTSSGRRTAVLIESATAAAAASSIGAAVAWRSLTPRRSS
jgi:hypothetical protein